MKRFTQYNLPSQQDKTGNLTEQAGQTFLGKGDLQSKQFRSGQQGYRLKEDGSAEFASNVIIRGEVNVNRLSYLKHTWILPFESVDAYSRSLAGGADSITPKIQALQWGNSGLLNGVTRLWVGEVLNITPDLAKNPSIKFSAKIGDPYMADYFVVWGDFNPFAASPLKQFGFKFQGSDQKVYACYRTAVNNIVVVEMVGINPGSSHYFEASIINENGDIKFLVDGIVSHIAQPRWVTWNSDYLFCIASKGLTGENATSYFWDFIIQQNF